MSVMTLRSLSSLLIGGKVILQEAKDVRGKALTYSLHCQVKANKIPLDRCLAPNTCFVASEMGQRLIRFRFSALVF